MSSDLAIRREARRQRILNNAETRLRRIVDGEKGPTEGSNHMIFGVICMYILSVAQFLLNKHAMKNKTQDARNIVFFCY